MNKSDIEDHIKSIDSELWDEGDWEELFSQIEEIDSEAKRRQAYYEKRMRELACKHDWVYEEGRGSTFASKYGDVNNRKCSKCERAERAQYQFKTVTVSRSWDNGQTWEDVSVED